MRKILVACRRILLAGAVGVLLVVGWVFWQAPSLNEMHPQLERVLARQFGLKSIQLGKLSWRWAGQTWLNAENITFTGPAERIRVEDAQLEVRISSWELLLGNIRPTSISLRHGQISLQLPRAAVGESLPVLSGVLQIEDSTVTLGYGEFSNRFHHLDLHLDTVRRNLSMQLPGFTLNVDWDKNLQPLSLHTRFDNLNWLPKAWRLRTRGEFSAMLDISKSAEVSGWQLGGQLNSVAGAVILNNENAPFIAFNDVHLQALIHTGGHAADIRRVEWQTIEWQDGDNHLSANGDWRDGQLNLAVQAETLHLEVLAGWAQALVGDGWREWLGGLRGSAQKLNAQLHLKQKKAWRKPELENIDANNIRLSAELSDVTIPLSGANELLQELTGKLNFDADGLNMTVQHVLLPHQAGSVHGKLHVADLNKPVFAIEGQGEVDVGRCERWLNPGSMPQLVWKQAPANARFAFDWPMYATQPSKGEAELTPISVWQVEIMQRPVLLRGGSMRWQTDGSLRFSAMKLHYDGFDATLDMQLQEQGHAIWNLNKLRMQFSGDFADIAARYRMPIDGASGHYTARLEFKPPQTINNKTEKGVWELNADLGNAAWRRLLGSHKNVGEPYALKFSGWQTPDGFELNSIRSHGGAPLVIGKGSMNKQRISLRISTLKAPAFSGELTVSAPFDDAPLEININSDFMDHSALPEQMPEIQKLVNIPATGSKARQWVMRGNFRHIRWDALSIRGVRINFASSTQGIGTLQADMLNAAKLSIFRVHAFFHLSSGGNVDIRNLTAQMLGQNLHLSGNLRPQPGGGLHWTGFADISGDFSQIIQRLDASKLFRGGVVHALWSGNGVIKAEQPWWNGMHGRLRLRSDKGRILEGGTMTKMLAALSLTDLPHFLTGKREDITGPGMLYKRLQLESTVREEKAQIRRLAMRASALDMAGRGSINLATGDIDLYVTARPLQNLDSFLRMIPLLRDLVLGAAKSVFRKIYHVYGPLQNAKVEAVSAEQAGLPEAGLLEALISLPGRWFDAGSKATEEALPATP